MKSKTDLLAYKNTPALVIDDDSSSRDILSDLLYEIGFKSVVEAPSAEDALTYLRNNKDWRGIILCDWNMPNMTGAQLYDHIKKTHPDIPFIMVTGRNDEESILYAKDSGIYAYILKPFSLHELQRKVAKITVDHSDFLKPPPPSDTKSSTANYAI